MEVVKKEYVGKDAIRLTLSREKFTPQVLCAIEESAKVHHQGLKLLELSTSDKFVVVLFSRPNTEDSITQYFDGHMHISTDARVCDHCKRKKVYCNITPK